MISSDELLRSKSIQELRLLARQLEVSVENQQNELRELVGSKYYDFIQSADAISDMYVKAKETELGLSKFLPQTQDVIIKTQSLLQHSTQSVITNDSKTARNITDINCDLVWNALEQCNVYEAAKLVYITRLLTSSTKFSNIGSHKISLKSTDSQQIDEKMKANWLSAEYLYQTVLDDSIMLLLIDGISIDEKARVLSSIHLLKATTNRELVNIYLNSAQSKIASCMSESSDSLNVLSTLEKIVINIQEVTTDIFSLFFQVNNNSTKGLVEVYKNSIFHEMISEVSFTRDVIVEESDSHTQVDLDTLGVFENWLIDTIKNVYEYVNVVLVREISSANEVSILQQHLWTITMGSLEHLGSHRLNLWNVVSNDFLTQVLENHFLKINNMEDVISPVSHRRKGCELLWDLVFRDPFIRQVERHLRQACHKVFMDTTELLRESFLSEGVVISRDMKRGVLTVSIEPMFLLETSKVALRGIKSPSYSVSSSVHVNSLRLNIAARKIHEELESWLYQIVVAILKPSMGDADDSSTSSLSLSYALFSQCSQLAAHLLVHLREILNAVNDAIANQLKLELSIENEADISKRLSCFSTASLLCGRLAWLLKNNCRIFDLILENPFANSINAINSHSKRRDFDLSSEDQLMSAFEIADTDGDGLVTFMEAEEALQALALPVENSPSNYSRDLGDCSKDLTEILSQGLTPTLTLHEFFLVCAQFQTSFSTTKASTRFDESLTAIVTRSHEIYASVAVKFAVSATRRLYYEQFSLNDVSHNSLKASSFKSCWLEVSLNEDLESKDSVFLPSSPTSALQSLLFRIKSTASELATIDALQVMLPSFSQTPAETAASSPSDISNISQRLIYEFAVEEIAHLYNHLLNNSNKEMQQEDVALQMAMDLEVCLLLYHRHNERLVRSLDRWKELVDPINASLMLPLLHRIAQTHFGKTFRFNEYHNYSSGQVLNSLHVIAADNINILKSTNKPIARFGLLALPLAITGSQNSVGIFSSSEIENKNQLNPSLNATSLMNSFSSISTFLGSG